MNFAVMRHADYDRDVLVESSVIDCRENVKTFLERLELGSVIGIFHSPIDRAGKTANVVHSAIEEVDGFTALAPEPRDFLKCDNEEITKESIMETIASVDGCTFGIFVSHMPDIERFLMDVNHRFSRVTYVTISAPYWGT